MICQVLSLCYSFLEVSHLFHKKLKISFSSFMKQSVWIFYWNYIICFLNDIIFYFIKFFVSPCISIFCGVCQKSYNFPHGKHFLLLDWLILNCCFLVGSLKFWCMSGRWCLYHEPQWNFEHQSSSELPWWVKFYIFYHSFQMLKELSMPVWFPGNELLESCIWFLQVIPYTPLPFDNFFCIHSLQ